jgi:predicted amidohydrolase YtcJ
MQVAVTRRPEGKTSNYPAFVEEECLTVEQVVRGYTTRAAAAAWRAEETGSLTPGRFADVILLDRDIFRADPYEIGETQVDLTLLGGRETHRSEKFDG